MFKILVTVAALAGFAAAQTITLQAESGKLSGVNVGASVAGYTGIQSLRKH
jgi:mannan endo-1,4-beta-mannosidase